MGKVFRCEVIRGGFAKSAREDSDVKLTKL
jgi:hypothetical protein